MCQVVHCKRDPFDVYIGRGNKEQPASKWANPFYLKDPKDLVERKKVVERYQEWVLKQGELMHDLWEIRGKVLGCWCAPRDCHGDVLSYLANDTEGTVRLIVAGSRTFTDYDLMCEVLDDFVKDFNDVIIIEGEAWKGADKLAKQYAKDRGYLFIPVPAKWKDGPDGIVDMGAGHKRNTAMAKIANRAVVFVDMTVKSTGSRDMLKKAKQYKLDPVMIKWKPKRTVDESLIEW